MVGSTLSLWERFWTKVDASGDCWLWIAFVDRHGHGSFTALINGRKSSWRAHRLAWELLVGPIADGLTLDHLCRNRRCVNPDHLEPVPMGVNILRGVGPSAINARKRVCIRGHDVWDLKRNGERVCRICKHEAYVARRGPRRLSPQEINALKTECLRGHPFNDENTYWNLHAGKKAATRHCRACLRQWSARKRAEQHAQLASEVEIEAAFAGLVADKQAEAEAKRRWAHDVCERLGI
jgi:hypothetical protein